MDDRPGRASVARRMVGERRRNKQRRVTDGCRWVERRQPTPLLAEGLQQMRSMLQRMDIPPSPRVRCARIRTYFECS
jgi:hypothetical protein